MEQHTELKIERRRTSRRHGGARNRIGGAQSFHVRLSRAFDTQTIKFDTAKFRASASGQNLNEGRFWRGGTAGRKK
jgi:hypothetical protein